MHEIIMALITNVSGWFALMIVGPCLLASVALLVRFGVRRSHVETMARIEADHREAMLKINRENPKLIVG